MGVRKASIRCSLAFLTGAAALVLFSHDPCEGGEAREKTIAVIAGTNSDLNIIASEMMSEALARNSAFRVLSPGEVAFRLFGYPDDTNIRGPYRPLSIRPETDYENTDISSIRVIRNALKADTVYVLWVPSITRSMTTVDINLMVLAFEGPDAREVYRDSFNSSTTTWPSCFGILPPLKERQLSNLKDTIDITSREFADHVSMLRQRTGR